MIADNEITEICANERPIHGGGEVGPGRCSAANTPVGFAFTLRDHV